MATTPGYTMNDLQSEITFAKKSVRASHNGSRVYFKDTTFHIANAGYLRMHVAYNVADGKGGFVEGDAVSVHTVAL